MRSTHAQETESITTMPSNPYIMIYTEYIRDYVATVGREINRMHGKIPAFLESESPLIYPLESMTDSPDREYNVTKSNEAALLTLQRDLRIVPDDEWEWIIGLYNLIPKASRERKSDFGASMVYWPVSALTASSECAHHIKGFIYPRLDPALKKPALLMRKTLVRNKTVSAYAIIYTARMIQRYHGIEPSNEYPDFPIL